MARIKGAMMTRKRRNKVLKAAKGYWGSKSKHFKMAKEAVMKSGNYAFAGRRRFCREAIGASVKEKGISVPFRGFPAVLRAPDRRCGTYGDPLHHDKNPVFCHRVLSCG